jgi:predicted ATP-grasp superfamily ATP-dependent carboligase
MLPIRQKLFVCEFITGGGLVNEILSESLLREGIMMRDALLTDLAALDQYELLSMHDYRVLPSNKVSKSLVVEPDQFGPIFDLILAGVDLVWIIAPEVDDILLSLSKRCYAANVIFLGCGIHSTAVASDKWQTYEACQDANIETLPTVKAIDWKSAVQSLSNHEGKLVAKPIDGVGCEGIHLFDDRKAVEYWLDQGACSTEKYLIQAFDGGKPASFSMLCKQGQAWLLSCNLQHIEMVDHRFILKGITVNGASEYWALLAQLAHDIAKMLPDAFGYLGVDVMIPRDHAKIAIIEINPRLTTSYVAMGQATGENIAGLMLDCLLDPHFCMPALQRNPIKIDIHAI